MEMEITISLKVIISNSWSNLNEICDSVRKSVRERLPSLVCEEVIKGMQDEVVDRLTTSSGRSAKKGLGGHDFLGFEGKRCRHRSFVKQGRRTKERSVRTDIGEVSFPLHYVSCRGCGKKFTPILDVLEIGSRQRHTVGLEHVVSDVVRQETFRRSERILEARGSPPVPRSSSHRWVSGRDLPHSSPSGLIFGMADGTGFKKWPGERGELRVVIGIDNSGGIRGLGTYSGKSWRQIGKDVRKKLKDVKEGPIQLRLFASDGERGLDRHLADVAERAQRCTWHVPRDLGYTLWQEGMDLVDRKSESRKLSGLLGVDIPAGDWEEVSDEDKKVLEEQVNRNEDELRSMVKEFRDRGYFKAATYLENSPDKLFSHVRLWLETGVIAPRTTSILENMMREIGRRVKKLGWNWSDRGVERISKMIILHHYDRHRWDSYWTKELGLKNRCIIFIEKVERVAA